MATETKTEDISFYYYISVLPFILIIILTYSLFDFSRYINLIVFSLFSICSSLLIVRMIKKEINGLQRFRIFLILLSIALLFYIPLSNVIDIGILNNYTEELTIIFFCLLLVLIKTQKKQKIKKSLKINNSLIILFLTIITLIGGYIRIDGVKDISFRDDEYQVIRAATGHLHTGEFLSWNFLMDSPDSIHSCPDLDETCSYYTRAYPHTWMISRSFKHFGISELSARIPSLIFGILLIPIGFVFSKYFTKREDISLIFSAFLSFYPLFISLSRYTRMYAIVIPVMLISTLLIYRGLFEKPKQKFSNEFLHNYFSYRYIELIVGICLLYLGYLLHINVIAFIPVLFVFIIYKYVESKEKKFIPFLLIGLLGILIAIVNATTAVSIPIINRIFRWVSLFERYNPSYIENLTNFPISSYVYITLLLISIFFIKKFSLKKKQRDKLVFLILNVIIIAISFVFIANRYASSVYISKFIPMSVLLFTWMFFLVGDIFLKGVKFKNIIIAGVLLSLFIALFRFDLISIDTTRHINYKDAYAIINNNFNYENDIVLGQYYRDYYVNPEKVNIERIYSLQIRQRLTYEEFLKIVNNAPSGYVVWAANKGGHIRPEIREYCCNNFKQLSGTSCSEEITDYRIEIFYFFNK